MVQVYTYKLAILTFVSGSRSRTTRNRIKHTRAHIISVPDILIGELMRIEDICPTTIAPIQNPALQTDDIKPITL